MKNLLRILLLLCLKVVEICGIFLVTIAGVTFLDFCAKIMGVIVPFFAGGVAILALFLALLPVNWELVKRWIP